MCGRVGCRCCCRSSCIWRTARARSCTIMCIARCSTRWRVNALYSVWLSVFYGFPAFSWIPTHNQNHHRYLNAEGDLTRTTRFSSKNTAWNFLTYPWVSSYYQAPAIWQFPHVAPGNEGLRRSLRSPRKPLASSPCTARCSHWPCTCADRRTACALCCHVRNPRAVRQRPDDVHELPATRALRSGRPMTTRATSSRRSPTGSCSTPATTPCTTKTRAPLERVRTAPPGTRARNCAGAQPGLDPAVRRPDRRARGICGALSHAPDRVGDQRGDRMR